MHTTTEDTRQDGAIWVQGRAVEIPAGARPSGHTPRALLRFSGPVTPAWRRALKKAGLTLRFWCPPGGACVDLPAQAAGQRRGPRVDSLRYWSALPFVVGATDYLADHCQRPPAATRRQTAAQALPWADIVCFDAAALDRVASTLQAGGLPLLGRSRSKLRVAHPADLAALRDLDGVKLAEPARFSRLLAAPTGVTTPPLPARPPVVRQAAALALAQAIGLPTQPLAEGWLLDGQGELIAIADTGLDSGLTETGMHPDFAGRITSLTAWPINPAWQSVGKVTFDDAADRASSHGTHVAGLACGSGRMSQGRHMGVAPAAGLVFQAIEQNVTLRPGAVPGLASGYYLSGRPLDLRELFEQAHALGAHIHNLSWGEASGGAYTDDCYETDLFLHEQPEAVIVCAMGNAGQDSEGDRRLDPATLYAPACAKNCIAVGATEGPLQNQGSRATWAALDPGGRRWRAPADRQAPLSGQADRIAPFSSCGPTRDGRGKPDLCAPGTNLPAPRSRRATGYGWGLAAPLPAYMYNGGTSMAAPVVSGALALIRQAWRHWGELPAGSPSGALLKALLLLGCGPVRGRAGGPAARHEAGFGGLHVGRSLPPALQAVPGWSVQVADGGGPGIDTGEQVDVSLQLDSPARLRAVLCWMDAPSERLVNDLDLTLLDASGTVLALGGLGGSGSEPDRLNPLECIDTGPLPAGRYRWRISGHNVMAGPQPWALAWASATVPGGLP